VPTVVVQAYDNTGSRVFGQKMRTIANWSPMLAAAIFVRLSRLLAYFNAPTPDSATVCFDLPDHLFETASPTIFVTLIFL